ncbi:hypothetical protein HanIR_Chr10g0464161 [Helianthus annuus]|nr:hypothetical protein HanIR_Chr10g0464161 [Helianthus annuus]
MTLQRDKNYFLNTKTHLFQKRTPPSSTQQPYDCTTVAAPVHHISKPLTSLLLCSYMRSRPE